MESILIIDDEQEVRDLYKSLLEGKPYRIDEAANGQDALQMASEHHYDLYLTDVMMPRMSGFDFLKNLHEIDSNAIVVIVSGFDDIAYNRQALMYGAWRYLVKPVKRAELWLVVDQGLKERRRLCPSNVVSDSPLSEKTPAPASAQTVTSPPEFPDTRAFDLLGRFSRNLSVEFHQVHAGEFESLLIQPFQRLWKTILALLPPTLTEYLETESNVFEPLVSKTLKGERARASYHASLVPRDGNRSHDGQLYLGIDARQIEFGFFIGEYGDDQRSLLIGNLQSLRRGLQTNLRPRLDRLGGVVGMRLARLLECRSLPEPKPMLEQWLEVPPQAGVHFSVIIPATRLPAPEVLAKAVSEAFSHLYPLVLLSQREKPITELSEYLGVSRSDWEEDEPSRPEPARSAPTTVAESARTAPAVVVEPVRQPEISLSRVAWETGIPEATLETWVITLRKHGQALLHALPGRGRTFIAESLARHLVGGGLGITDTIPLHPAYDYPAFMRRLIDFVERMGRRREPCVLVLDNLHGVDWGRTFGELPYLADHRDQPVMLAYEGIRLALPSNLLLLATVERNALRTADPAYRRRIPHLSCNPDLESLIARHGELAPHAPVLAGLLGEVGEKLGGDLLDLHHWIRGLPETLSDLPGYWKAETEPLFDAAAPESGLDEYRWENLPERSLQASGTVGEPTP